MVCQQGYTELYCNLAAIPFTKLDEVVGVFYTFPPQLRNVKKGQKMIEWRQLNANIEEWFSKGKPLAGHGVCLTGISYTIQLYNIIQVAKLDQSL